MAWGQPELGQVYTRSGAGGWGLGPEAAHIRYPHQQQRPPLLSLATLVYPLQEPASPHRPSLQRLQGLKPGPAMWLPCSVPRDEQRSERERPDFSGAYPAAALETRSSALPEATAIRVQSFRWTSLNCSASVRQGKQSSELETKSGICQVRGF